FLGISLFLLQATAFQIKAYALESYKKFYLKGLEHKENGRYDEAIEAFAKAISKKSKEKKKIRFYGMRYGEYMPHREKGICHYMLKQYNLAAKELDISLSKIPTDEAKKYSGLARMELKKLKPEDIVEVVRTPEELKNFKQANSVNRHAVAVIIGNMNYNNKDIPPVNYAVSDATRVKECLIRTFGYRAGNIIFKTNASKGIFENTFGSALNYKGMLYDYVTPGKSDVFVYYSGHGAPSLESKKGYILPVDGNPNNVSISGYPLELLYGNLAKLRAKSITVVTDACFSGATLFKKASPVGIIVKNPLVALKNTSIINSSAGTELSSWYPEKGHGLFTYYFLLGLTGKADVNRDKNITLKEISAYINDHVPYMARTLHSGRKQTPTFKTYKKSQVLVRYK
ncbi:MAG: caspase family protein, partial [Deltaproteobacteria bacterium]|nr:caspase family protein [Deltaproteobacteria bacterium]